MLKGQQGVRPTAFGGQGKAAPRPRHCQDALTTAVPAAPLVEMAGKARARRQSRAPDGYMQLGGKHDITLGGRDLRVGGRRRLSHR
jgi:hypothetical protein